MSNQSGHPMGRTLMDERRKNVFLIAGLIRDGYSPTASQRRIIHAQDDDDRANILTALLHPIVGKANNTQMLARVDMTVRTLAEFFARHGIGFPQLVAVYVESRGHLDLVRADLEPVGIQRVVMNLIQRFPDIHVEELVPAVRHAFPAYQGLADEAVEMLETKRPALVS